MSIESIFPIVVSILIALIGIIYHLLVKRIDALEKWRSNGVQSELSRIQQGLSALTTKVDLIYDQLREHIKE